MFRGRWKQADTARTYLQTGRALLALQDVPARVNQLGMDLDDCLVELLSDKFFSIPLKLPRQRRVHFSKQH